MRKTKKQYFSLFSCLLCIIMLSSLTPSAHAEDFTVEAKAALLLDLDTGDILHEQNIHERLYPASITKVMTTMLVLEAIEAGALRMEDIITVSETAMQGLAKDGSNAGIQVGEILTIEQLLYCALISSANEACNILAEAVSGTVEAFVALMNTRAGELGCKNTHFGNTNGLHRDDHYTSAWDISLIVREALKHPVFVEITSTATHTIPATNLSKERTLRTTNYLISGWYTRSYLYRGAQGIKTGYTPQAGYCLTSSASRGDTRLLSVVLGAERITDEEGIVWTHSFLQTMRLFDHGFDDFERMTLLSADDAVYEVPVDLSSETNYVVAHPAEELRRLMPTDVKPEDISRSVKLVQEVVDAPVHEGDVLGEITLYKDDMVFGTVTLLALHDVPVSQYLVFRRAVMDFFSIPAVHWSATVLLILLSVVLGNNYRIASQQRKRQRAMTGTRKRY